jgi:uncharacterized protein (TIGR02145 family)
MRIQFSKLVLSAAFALALPFTLSCSNDGDESKLNTVKKERVTGISQKGPFARDSKVTIYELNAKFGKTENRSEGKTDGDGSFEIRIKNGELASPYVILEANGRYFNEASGEITTTPITLNAIADMSGKSQANINVLTHLELERVLELAKGGKSFSAAKKQAQREVLEALGMDIGERGLMNSEYFDIFGSGKGDSLLRVASILLQGNRPAEEVSSLLGKFAGEIRDRGASESIIEEVKKGLEEVDIEKVKDYMRERNPKAAEPDLSPYLPPKPPEVPLSSSAFNPSTNSNTPSVPGGNTSGPGGSVQKRSSSSLAVLPSSTSGHSSSSEEHSSSSDEEHSSSSLTSSSSEHSSSSEEHSSSSHASSSSGCTAANNTATQYCSNGTMKFYGSVTHEGQSYKTVEIGTQVWMAENLNYNADSGDSKCPDTIEANCTIYGGLYRWVKYPYMEPTILVCPSGWHLPSDVEWATLTDFVGGAAIAGTKLKAINGWNTSGDYIPGTDDYGFSALPGGFGYFDGGFNGIGSSGSWWSAYKDSVSQVYQLGMYSNSEGTIWYASNNPWYFRSVRCLQD